jgi:DNA (cytosine-5)-methyltransferase 1
VCSGIEAATVAWHPLGWEPVAFSEINPFASAVLAHHWADVPNLGDLTNHESWPIEPGAIDLLVGGTPCQSFSIAGLRQGLADPRGNLALTYLAILDRLRPRWFIWENVPGVLSSNGGKDFGSFIGALGDIGYGFAYRVLDAQYCRVDGFERAVPQRRRRVFVVGHLGDWKRAAQVLFKPKGVRGDSASSRKARKASPDGARTRAASRDGCDGRDGLVPDLCKTLTTRVHLDSEIETFIPVVADPITSNEGNTYSHAGNNAGKLHICISQSMGIRRLTPRECERLQGFPDDHTLIPYRGKPASDAPRYKAIGNSMAINAMRWIGRRIAAVDNDR